MKCICYAWKMTVSFYKEFTFTCSFQNYSLLLISFQPLHIMWISSFLFPYGLAGFIGNSNLSLLPSFYVHYPGCIINWSSSLMFDLIAFFFFFFSFNYLIFCLPANFICCHIMTLVIHRAAFFKCLLFFNDGFLHFFYRYLNTRNCWWTIIEMYDLLHMRQWPISSLLLGTFWPFPNLYHSQFCTSSILISVQLLFSLVVKLLDHM